MYVRTMIKNAWNGEEDSYSPLQIAIIKKYTMLNWSGEQIFSLQQEHRFVSSRVKNPLALILVAALYAKVWKQSITHVLANMDFSWEDLDESESILQYN